jgi:hypothetical protein
VAGPYLDTTQFGREILGHFRRRAKTEGILQWTFFLKIFILEIVHATNENTYTVKPEIEGPGVLYFNPPL